VIFCSVCSGRTPEHYNLSLISKGVDLYSGNIYGLKKDSNGYLWWYRYGTIYRYDGKEWDKFVINLGGDIEVEKVNLNASLKEDFHRNLWLGNSSGLFYFIKETGETEKMSINFPEIEVFSKAISNVVVYSDKRIFFIAGQEPYVMDFEFDHSKKELRECAVTKVLQKSQPIYSLATLSNDGELWLFANNHAIRYNPEMNQVKKVKIDFNFKQTKGLSSQHQIYTTDQGVIWIGVGNSGIYSYNIKTGRLNHFLNVEGNQIRTIQDIKGDKQGNVWVASTLGLIHINQNTFPTNPKLVKVDSEVKNRYLQYVNSIHVDEDGFLLMITNGGEIVKLEIDQEDFNFLPINTGFNVTPIYTGFNTTRVTPNDEVIKVRNHRSASKIVSVKTEERVEKDFLTYTNPGDRILGFEIVDGHLWVGSLKSGLSIFDLYSKKELSNSSFNNILSAFKNIPIIRIIKHTDSRVYIAARNGVVYIVSKDFSGYWNYEQIDFNFNKATLHAVPFLVSSDNWLWTANPLSTLVGISPDGEIRKIKLKLRQAVCSICEGPGNSLLVGLYSGLLKVDRESGEVTILDDFDDVSIFNIVRRDSTEFWFTSYRRLFRYNGQSGKVDIISHENGLPDCRFQANSSVWLDNGDLGFGTLNKGILHFSPAKIGFTAQSSRVKIIGIEVNGEALEFEKENRQLPFIDAQYPYVQNINLDHFHKLLSIQFSAFEYQHEENIQYTYFLEGVDKSWNLAKRGGNEVTYSNLAPGSYTFKVKATCTRGAWEGEETYLQIDIRPAWYQTTLAKLFFLLGTLLLIAFFWWYTIGKVRLKEQLKREIAEKDKEKEMSKMKLQFFTNISHEFKTPLSLLFGPLKRLRSETEVLSKEDKENLFELMSRNISHLMDMINQLMDFRKVENKAIKLRVRPVNISRFIEDEFNKFKHEADLQKKTFLLEREIKEPVFGWVDTDKLLRILSNLLSNAIKYTSHKGIIRLHYAVKGNGVELKVIDNGVGIDEKHLPHIFERYYRIEEDVSPNQRVPGTGIGLTLCRDLAELMKGDISVSSVPGKGTSFQFWFPINSSSFGNDEREEEAVKESLALEKDSQEKLTVDSNRDKPLLLVVEDNPNMQNFIEGILKNRYTIEFAANGFEGIEKCDKIAPDLVVSDVMMPEMDGFEMVRKLKEDVRISHIPIILLTALSSPEHRVEGARTGADLYIQKPFDPEFLQISINNLVESRKRLRQQFGKSIVDVKISDITITKTDEKFLDEIMGIIEERLFDSEFKIEEIHSEIGMSRSQFYRKIKALTDQTAGDFVKSLRLKKAATLLREQSELRVSDVCYAVGFTDPAYFGKVFRKNFGMSPSDYSKSGK